MIALVNGALAEAGGEFVARMDADDVAHPERFAEQVAFLDANPEVDVIDSRVSYLGGGDEEADGRGLGMQLYCEWLNTLAGGERGGGESHDAIVRDFLIESPIVQPAVMARRGALVAAGGYRDGDFPEDYDLWLRLFLAGRRFAKLPRALLEWRDHAARLTRTHPRYRLAAFFGIKSEALWALDGERLRRGRTVVWGAGNRGRPWRRFLRGRGVRPAFLVDVDARKIGRALSGVPVRALDALATESWDTLLVVVGARGARDLIRAHLAGAGFLDANGEPAAGRQVRFVQ